VAGGGRAKLEHAGVVRLDGAAGVQVPVRSASAKRKMDVRQPPTVVHSTHMAGKSWIPTVINTSDGPWSVGVPTLGFGPTVLPLAGTDRRGGSHRSDEHGSTRRN
jgi:hypothetical protein